jgi:Rrf2 family cysteine metabolism transcriptional repressor
MKLSKKGEYAIRALICLAALETPVMLSIQEIARREGIPKKFLEQVLLALNKAGVVQSMRGKAGGYVLHRTPEGITLGDIVRAVDGPIAPLRCANPDAPVKCADCVSLDLCWLRPVMVDVGATVNAALERVTLADMARRASLSRRSRNGHALMYEI